MRVLAFDQATSTGWALGSDIRALTYGRWAMPKRQEPHERLGWLYDKIIALGRESAPDMLAYEAPWHPQPNELVSNWKTIQWAQKIEALVLLAAYQLTVPVECYVSSSWRLTICGFGRAPKGQAKDFMKRAVQSRVRALGYGVVSTDEADAIGIAIHALTGRPAALRQQADLLDLAAQALR